MITEGGAELRRSLGELVRMDAVKAYPDEPLRVVVYKMAEKGFTRMPILERGTEKFLGLVALDDLLKARGRNLEEERTHERPLKLRFPRVAGPLTIQKSFRTRPKDGTTARRRVDQVVLKTPRDLFPLKGFAEPLRAVLAARVRKPLSMRLHNLSLGGGAIAANNGSSS